MPRRYAVVSGGFVRFRHLVVARGVEWFGGSGAGRVGIGFGLG
jgi:hypothetical protein